MAISTFQNSSMITNHFCSFPQDGLSKIFKAIRSNKMALKGKLTTHWTMWSSSTHREEFQHDAIHVNVQHFKATLLCK